MVVNHAALTYRRFSVQGATPLGLVVVLYDGTIAALHGAIAAIEAHDVEAKCKHLGRALAIIAQLEGTLDFELGGEVAQNLNSFYGYARAQAMQANIENSAQNLRSLIEHFTTLRDAWREGEHRLATQDASSPANGGIAQKDWGDAGTVELSVLD